MPGFSFVFLLLCILIFPKLFLSVAIVSHSPFFDVQIFIEPPKVLGSGIFIDPLSP